MEKLTVIQARQWLGLNLREIWNYRELLGFLTWRDVLVRYKQTVIGVAWAVLQPVLTMVVFSIFFGALANIPTNGIPYPLFSYCAILPWQLFSRSLIESSNSLVANQQLVTKVYFPRILIPLTSIFSNLIDFFIAFGVLFVMMYFYDYALTWKVLVVPVFILLALATSLAASLWLSALNVMYRDVRYMIPFLVQLGLFLTPVIYPSSLLPANLQVIYALNPMVGVIEGFRWALLNTNQEISTSTLISVAVVLLTLFGGLVFFQRQERSFADMI